jgi:hypothetical protein
MKATKTTATIINHITYPDYIHPKDYQYIYDCNHSWTIIDLVTTVLVVNSETVVIA